MVLDRDEYTQIYGGEAVYYNGVVISRVRSGGYGYTLKKNILYAYLPPELAKAERASRSSCWMAAWLPRRPRRFCWIPKARNCGPDLTRGSARARTSLNSPFFFTFKPPAELFMTISIEEVVQQIDDWQGKAVRIQPLSGGLTNTNYQVEVDGQYYFVRIPGAKTDLLAIDRNNEYHNTCAAAEAVWAPGCCTTFLNTASWFWSSSRARPCRSNP